MIIFNFIPKVLGKLIFLDQMEFACRYVFFSLNHSDLSALILLSPDFSLILSFLFFLVQMEILFLLVLAVISFSCWVTMHYKFLKQLWPLPSVSVFCLLSTSTHVHLLCLCLSITRCDHRGSGLIKEKKPRSVSSTGFLYSVFFLACPVVFVTCISYISLLCAYMCTFLSFFFSSQQRM